MKSRRRSEPSSHSTPLEPPVFFLDKSVATHAVASPLRDAGLRVELHGDHFSPGTEDPVWLATVGQRGWFVLTRDTRIRYRRSEIEAAREAKVGMFVLGGKNLDYVAISRAIAMASSGMMRLIRRVDRPFVATITAGGSVSLVKDAGAPRESGGGD